MRKKGFTLVEIIICISLLVVIGVGSFISIRVISKKQLIDKLNMISDKASEAAQVYIETNKSASNQLYNNKNGVSLPLQLLVNEGLLSLKGTKLTENDIKNQYVVTFLGGTGSTENCEPITSVNSWSNNQPIYLCMNSDGSGSNLAIIDPTKYSNKTAVSNEPYYFKGMNPMNYIIVQKKDETKVTCRIVFVDRDDSIVVETSEDLKNGTLWYDGIYDGTPCVSETICFIATDNMYKSDSDYTGGNVNGIIRCTGSWLNNVHVGRNSKNFKRIENVKITGGTGSCDKPFTVEYK